HEAQETPDIDGLREVVDNQALISWAVDVQQSGPKTSDRGRAFREVLDRFRETRRTARRQQLMDRLRMAETDDERRRLLGEIQDLARRPAPPPGGQSPGPRRGGPAAPADGEWICHEEAWNGLETRRHAQGPDRTGQAERVPDLGPGQRPDPAGHRRAGAPGPDS